MGTYKKRSVSKRQAVVSIIIGGIAMIVIFGFVALSVTPIKYDLTAGKTAPVTISACKDVTDTVSTEAAIAQAEAEVLPMYTIDDAIKSDVEIKISGFFEDMILVTEYVFDEYIDDKMADAAYGVSKEDFENSYDPSDIDWEEFLTKKQINKIRDIMGEPDLPDSIVYKMASLEEAQIMKIKEDVRDIVQVSLDNGIREEHLQTEKDGIDREIESLYSDRDISYVAYLPVEENLQANMLYDKAATQKAKDEAADKISPVMYKQSQTVVVAGETVTEAQLAVLQELGVVGGEKADYTLYIGMFLFIALLFCVYGVYLYQFESEILAETRKLLILAVISALIVAISVPLSRLDSRIIPVFFGTMLASVLVSQKSALALNIFLAFIVGAVCSWNTGLLSVTMLSTVMMTIIGGSVSVFALYRPGHRASLIFAGLIAGGVNVAVALLVNLIGSGEFLTDSLLIDCAYALGSGILAGVLAIGTLPIWEAIFRVSTPTKLLELSNSNHPLLKRLTVEAPGTYHHSVLTANLAEAGADAVGANALLCRVGAYYHDVGKLKNPKYFKENQKGDNPHDKLKPSESAKIITGHIAHGLELAQKYKLPRDIQKILVQHHGDAVVSYFYHKATEEGREPDEAAYRYKGSKPSTKESAIVMLADCVEAAVRSMDDPDQEQAREMINKLIKDKYNDGQLDECPLNRRDLNIIAKAFLNVFDGALHERVKYPGQEQ